MKRLCLWSVKRSIASLLIVGLASASHAVVIDLSKMTCQEFLTSDKDEIRIIWAWLDGYYKDEQDPPIIDIDRMVDNLRRLNEYCARNPTVALITTTDRLFGK